MNGKTVTETKNTCESCGREWYFGKQDERDRKNAQLHNASKGLMCCGGCVPALLIKDKEVKELKQCPNCGSRAIKQEKVTHYV